MANYLYNGVNLPDINTKWTNKETYPNAVVGYAPSVDAHILVLSKNGVTINRYNDTLGYYCYSSILNLHYKLVDGVWTSYSSQIAIVPIWSSYDLLYGSVEDIPTELQGTLYLAASEPVPVTTVPFDFNPACYILGRQFGKRIIAQRKPKKPVAYLYNGVQLPALPEWDKTVYPYAVIAYLAAGPIYRLYFCADRCTVTDTDALYKAPYIWYTSAGDNWVYEGEETSTYSPILTMVTPIWANHDVLHEGGSIYFAASEPIPVYE